jgi:hypothetical protein
MQSKSIRLMSLTLRNDFSPSGTGRMRFRKLRIAWSMGWGTAELLLLVLHLHSYMARDSCRIIGDGHVLNLVSLNGELGVGFYPFPPRKFTWNASSEPDNMGPLWPPVQGSPPLSYLGIRWMYRESKLFVVLPYWLLATAAAILRSSGETTLGAAHRL